MNMSPLDLQVLLSCYTHPIQGYNGPCKQIAVDQCKLNLIAKELLDMNLTVTPRGKAFIERILETPLPAQQWGYEHD